MDGGGLAFLNVFLISFPKRWVNLGKVATKAWERLGPVW